MRRWTLPLMVLLGLFLAGCGRAPDVWKDARPGQPRVLATFPPLYAMAHAVAGDDAYVLCLLTTTGPHDYQADNADMRKLRAASLIVANGLSLDDRFLHKLVAGAGVPPERVFKAGDALPKDTLIATGPVVHGLGADAHTHAGGYDPHVWLGPPQAAAMTRALAKRLGEVDPKHRAGYEARAEAFVKELEAVADAGTALLRDKKDRLLLTQHESLAYFAKAFGLEVVGSIQAQPGQDPDAKQLSELAQECRKKGVRVIAVEPQFPKTTAVAMQDQLRRQGLDVRLAEVDPIETAPPAAAGNPDPRYYLTRLRQNIEALARALP